MSYTTEQVVQSAHDLPTDQDIEAMVAYLQDQAGMTMSQDSLKWYGIGLKKMRSLLAATPPQPQQIEDKDREIERLKIELDMTQQNLTTQKGWDEKTINDLQAELTALKASPEISRDQIKKELVNYFRRHGTG